MSLVVLAGTLPAADLTDNLVVDGGLEEWQTTGPQDGWWSYLTVSCKSTDFGRDEKGQIFTPAIFSQAYETKVLKPETQDLHGGRKALRLKGQFYLANSRVPNAYNTQDGDIYLVRYWVKGTGQTRLYLHVYGDAITQFLEEQGKPEKDRWSLIEERIQVVGPAPTTIYPRLWASEEMLFDDISICRVTRESERQLEPVPADCQERVAFATPAGEAVTLDGKLDEPAWTKAVPFRGFRSAADQALLAAAQPCFRVLSDPQNLYFGVEIPLANARQMLGELKNRPLLDSAGQPRPITDTYTSRESVEFFLQAPGRSQYCQLVVSLDGYRYDSVGEEKAWNGTWEWAITAADDRWFIELKLPVRDLGLDQAAPAEGWRLNLCVNQPDGCATWAAVGPAFHNPNGFGKLVVQDFAAWREQQPAVRTQRKTEILQAAGPDAARYAERLAKIDAGSPPSATTAEKVQDWAAITRVYAQMDYTGNACRCVAEEVRYRKFFAQP